MSNLVKLAALILLAACSRENPTERERALNWHATEFARQMRLTQHVCTLPGVYGIECSGVLDSRPVVFECDGFGCKWAQEDE